MTGAVFLAARGVMMGAAVFLALPVELVTLLGATADFVVGVVKLAVTTGAGANVTGVEAPGGLSCCKFFMMAAVSPGVAFLATSRSFCSKVLLDSGEERFFKPGILCKMGLFCKRVKTSSCPILAKAAPTVGTCEVAGVPMVEGTALALIEEELGVC